MMAPAAQGEPHAGAGVRLEHLAVHLGADPRGPLPRVTVIGVQQDSRRVQPGDLFVAVRGRAVDGGAYAGAAVERGAVAVLCERGSAVGVEVPVLEVAAVRTALARAAALVYGLPTERLHVVGITGTNGKTTTSLLTAACIDASGGRAGIVGTLGYRFGDLELPATHTSPEADELQRVAARMLARGATHLAMEVSSIALDADRVAEVRFEVGAFTNLTQDHLDYHGSMEAYAAAKERLFVEHAPAVAVINVDDPFGAALADRVPGRTRVIRTSQAPRSGDAVAVVAPPDAYAGSDLRFTVRTPRGELAIETPLVGRHNVDNALTAIGIGEALGLDPAAVVRTLASPPPVPGRLERVSRPADDDIVAVVDYAHTPDALARVLASLRSPKGRIFCVFGCGGDRDRTKRGPMGEVAARGADVVVVTNDNPRSEDPRTIADAIVAGLQQAGSTGHRVELDRAAAIDLAVREAAPGDVVLVAGKGHEPYQIIGDRVTAFDDRLELANALARRRGS
jgi:UDP-N-acetylmuramoyl-L-alanyl-D-glutamate--2,6-diaminopimelate ligase